ncbi:MAG TPA: ArsA family ATPase [Candidatus Binataceae bacterium]|jgi:anion-transporting  ArsA/GET3 family ATPase
MLTQLFERRLIVVLGKGGVGKSTTSAALATCAARQGIRTLLMETDSRAPVAGTLGVERSFKPVPVRAGFSTMVLEGGHALDEYLALVLPARAVLKAVFASRLYQFFVQAAPGLRELMMLGKVCYELSPKDHRARWDLVVVDAPASGQALSLLKMPTAARATFGASVVGQEAENIERTLHDRKLCAIVEVTTPETLAVSELLETQKALAAMDFPPAAIFLNRAATTDFSAGDVMQFARRAEATHGLRHLEQLTEAARAELARAAQTPRAHAKLARLSRASIMELPDLPGRNAETLVTHLASFFASRLNSGGVRHDAAKG